MRDFKRSTPMKITLSYLTPLLAAGAAAAAISAAPTAAAADVQSCPSASAVCHSPGNVSIDDSPASVQVGPYGPFYDGYARGRD
jgi:hypothetical protein